MMDFKKPTKIRSAKIRQSAEGRHCTLRTPRCNGNPETVVFCHAPSKDKGTATKSSDFWGAYGCSSCHAWVEENRNKANEYYWMPAIYETLKILFTENLIQIN